MLDVVFAGRIILELPHGVDEVLAVRRRGFGAGLALAGGLAGRFGVVHVHGVGRGHVRRHDRSPESLTAPRSNEEMGTS